MDYMLMKDFQILSCHPGNDDIMLTDKRNKTECSMKNKASLTRVSQTLSLCASPLYHPGSPSPLAKPHCRFCLLSLFTLGEWAESHQYTLQHSCSAALHCFLSLQTALILFCKLPFPCPTHTHIQCSGPHLLLLHLPSTNFNQHGLMWSVVKEKWVLVLQRSWKAATAKKKIGTHAPDETSQDKSQHEMYQASLLRRRQIMKPTQRKQYRCNLLYIRTSESVLELMWL